MELLSQQYNQSITEFYRGCPGVSTTPPIIDFLGNFENENSVFLKNQKAIERFESPSSVFFKKLGELQRLETLYTFKNPIEIKRFLLTHDYLINSLFEAHVQIRKTFQHNIIRILLKHDRDPEEDFEGLFITIETNLSPEQSLDLLEKFDYAWWLHVDFEIRSVITIMVKPV